MSFSAGVPICKANIFFTSPIVSVGKHLSFIFYPIYHLPVFQSFSGAVVFVVNGSPVLFATLLVVNGVVIFLFLLRQHTFGCKNEYFRDQVHVSLFRITKAKQKKWTIPAKMEVEVEVEVQLTTVHSK